MRLSSIALLEGGDADGLVEGEEVTLKNWGNVKIVKLDKDDGGEPSQIDELFQNTKIFFVQKKASTLVQPKQLYPPYTGCDYIPIGALCK